MSLSNCLDVEVTAEVQEGAEDFECDWCAPYIAFMRKLKLKEGTVRLLDHCEMEVDQPEQDD